MTFMYPQAVESGIPATDYWLMTLEEIMVQIHANKRRKENELREKAMFDYSQQRLAIYAFNKPSQFPKFEDAYPFLNKSNQKEESEDTIQDKVEPYEREKQLFMAQAEAIKSTRERKDITKER